VFSMGQRQLLCMCRALLKKSALVIQDDATTNVDIPTSQALQAKILERYKDSTILTMTHRVLTIALYDKVVISHKGEIQEFGEPYLLLVDKIGDTEVTNKDSYMARMTKNLGKTLSKLVVKTALRTYYKKHGIMLPAKEVMSSINLDNIASKIKIERAVGSSIVRETQRRASLGSLELDLDIENHPEHFKDLGGDEDDDIGIGELHKDSIRPFNKFDVNISKND